MNLFPSFILVLACLYVVRSRSLPEQQQVQLARNAKPVTTNSSSKATLHLKDGTSQLQLCECTSAIGFPNGLGCEREGWFVSAFEHEGTWASGGGLVPLSHAVCCRPCLPAELPRTEGDKPPPKPIGWVTLGCHASLGKSWESMQCDSTTSSFVTGFTSARQVANYYDIYYPEGATQCCSPGLLLSSGDVWELQRCNCESADSRSCGGTTSHLLLTGFESARLSAMMQWVPVAPLQCCGLCLGPGPRSLQDCRDLSFCSGQGVCALGVCECNPGYTGPDCSMDNSDDSGDDDGFRAFPSWATWTMIVGGITSSMLSTIALRARHASRSDDSTDGGGDVQQLLLPYGDEAGSVGSQDTEEEGEEEDKEGEEGEEEEELDEAVEVHEHDSVDVVERGLAEAGADAGAGAGAAEEPPRPSIPHPHPALHASPSGARAATPTSRPTTPQPPSPRPQQQLKTEAPPKELPPSLEGLVPLAGTEALCSICIERPIQVALVPCGHANLCRRCSRRLDKCPFCRVDILRRQRLFYSL